MSITKVRSLTIRFGNQVRHKCRECTLYLKRTDPGQTVICRCGAQWQREAEDFVMISGRSE